MYTVYLIHLDENLHHARHYLGYTSNLDSRVSLHKSGGGSRMLAACNEAGISYRVVRTWEFKRGKDARDLERSLKRHNNTPRLCPICNPTGWIRRGKC